MTEDKLRSMGAFLQRNKAVLLVLALGLVLLLLPGRTGSAASQSAQFDTEEEKLAAVLSQIQGAGDVYVLLQEPSESKRGGAVVVCDGAESAQVCLEITRAVSAYTGLGSDRIIILKTEQGGK